MPVINVPVAIEADDGAYGVSGSDFDATGNVVIEDARGVAQAGFFRFTPDIPAGALINSAVLSVTPALSATDPWEVDILAVDEADAATITSAADGQARTLTTSEVGWVASNWTSGVGVNSPESAAVLQEVVDLPSWTSGNGFVVILLPVGLPAGRQIQAVDAVLTVDYTITNTAPSITSGPSVAYFPYGKVSPNFNGTYSFTATDADAGDQGSNALFYELRTGPNGTGSLLSSSLCTSGMQVNANLIAEDLEAIGFPENIPTPLYVRVRDDDLEWSSDGQADVTVVYAHDTDVLIGETLLLLVTSGDIEIGTLNTGWLTPTLAGNVSGGFEDWLNPTNAIIDDAVYSVVSTATARTQTDYLGVKSFNFNLPDGAVPDGVEVRINGQQVTSGAGNGEIISTRLYFGSGFGFAGLYGTNKSTLLPLPNSTETTHVVGSPTDLWGTTDMTREVVNSSDFGVGVRAWNESFTDDPSCEVQIDLVEMRIHYHIEPGLIGESILLAQTRGEYTTHRLNLSGESLLLLLTEGVQSVTLLGGESVLLTLTSGEASDAHFILTGESVLLLETSGEHLSMLSVLTGESVLLLSVDGETFIPIIRRPALKLSYLSVLEKIGTSIRIVQ